MPRQFPLLGMRGPRPYVAIHRRSFQSSRLRHPRCNFASGQSRSLTPHSKFEAKRIALQTVHLTRREETDRREAWREYEISKLQREIVLATLDHPPKGWDDHLRSPDYLPPPGDGWPPTGRTADGKLILFPDKKERG